MMDRYIPERAARARLYNGPVTAARLRPLLPTVNRVGAVFIIVVGLLMLTNTFARLAGLFYWGAL